LKFIENTKVILIIIILIFWIVFTIIGYLLNVTNYRKEANLKLLKWVPLGFAAFIFIALTICISIHKFYSENFCLMNSQDVLCSSDETDCFGKKVDTKSVYTSDFGFGKFLMINSTAQSDLGKRYKIFGKHKKPH